MNHVGMNGIKQFTAMTFTNVFKSASLLPVVAIELRFDLSHLDERSCKSPSDEFLSDDRLDVSRVSRLVRVSITLAQGFTLHCQEATQA
jgi:hypothetical protein